MSDVRFNSKLPATGVTIFSVMSALAAEQKAINLSQGFPDFDPDSRLLDVLTAVQHTDVHQYAAMPGLPLLRDRISSLILQNIDVHVPVQHVTVTAGATQAIYTAVSAMVHPGDEVIIFTPAYDCYEPAIRVNGGVARICPLDPDTYTIDWDMFKALIGIRTKGVIINSPHNPTGTVMTRQDFLILEQLAVEYGFWVISDEVYDHVNYSDEGHLSVLSFPGLQERSFVIGSFGKIFHITGWKIGYCVAPEPLTTEFRKVHQFNVFSVNSLAQHTLAAYLEDMSAATHVKQMYAEKRELMRNGLKQSRFKLLPCAGTYFQTVDYSDISELNDVEFTRWMTIEHKVAAIPLSVFSPEDHGRRHIRLCFAKKQETLESALERLCAI